MRVQVNISDELLARIEVQAKKLGVTRSSYCAMKIAQGVQGDEMAFQSYQDMTQHLGVIMSDLAQKEFAKNER